MDKSVTIKINGIKKKMKKEIQEIIEAMAKQNISYEVSDKPTGFKKCKKCFSIGFYVKNKTLVNCSCDWGRWRLGLEI